MPPQYFLEPYYRSGWGQQLLVRTFGGPGGQEPAVARRKSPVVTAEEGVHGESLAPCAAHIRLLPLFQVQQAQCTRWLTP